MFDAIYCSRYSSQVTYKPAEGMEFKFDLTEEERTEIQALCDRFYEVRQPSFVEAARRPIAALCDFTEVVDDEVPY